MRSARAGLGWDEANFECGKCGKSAHTFHAEHGEYNDVYEIRCTICEITQKVPRHTWLSQLSRDYLAPGKANLTRYPRIEPHSGMTVNSRDDEVRVMKAMGMHAAPHGVNERYNDEACDILRRRRLEHEKRKRDREERARYRRRG